MVDILEFRILIISQILRDTGYHLRDTGIPGYRDIELAYRLFIFHLPGTMYLVILSSFKSYNRTAEFYTQIH